MKLPKTRRTYCPFCKSHQDHKVVQVKSKTLGSAHPMSHGAKARAKLRGIRGAGNHGRYSKPPITKWRLAGRKTSKKIDLRFECQKCKKQHIAGNAWRARKAEFKQ